MKKFRSLWILLLAVVALVVFLSAAFWPILKVYLAPKTALAAAVSHTYRSLAERTQNSPLLLIGKTLDFENGNTIDLMLDSNQEGIGATVYDMEIQTEWNPVQIAARGAVSNHGKVMDLSVYLDENFGAISSNGLLQGRYYGLTYDNFGQDIRSNPLISLVIGEESLAEMEKKVDAIQNFMSRPVTIPSVQKSDLQRLFSGILALSPEVDRESVMLDNMMQECFIISFETTGAQIQAGLEYLDAKLPISFDPEAEIDISFWMKDGWIHRIAVESENRELVMVFGAEELAVIYDEAGHVRSVLIHTQQTADTYRERIQISAEEYWDVSYNWNPISGEMTIDGTREGERTELTVTFLPTETGFSLVSSDFHGLMHLLLQTKDSGDSPCVLNVSKGADIETPEYQNFSQWSLDDFLSLMSGLGSLFGINLA